MGFESVGVCLLQLLGYQQQPSSSLLPLLPAFQDPSTTFANSNSNFLFPQCQGSVQKRVRATCYPLKDLLTRWVLGWHLGTWNLDPHHPQNRRLSHCASTVQAIWFMLNISFPCGVYTISPPKILGTESLMLATFHISELVRIKRALCDSRISQGKDP